MDFQGVGTWNPGFRKEMCWITEISVAAHHSNFALPTIPNRYPDLSDLLVFGLGTQLRVGSNSN
jgi:hypothetical protein